MSDAVSETAGLRWGGVHHIALVTPDLDATVQFYRDTLGLVVTRMFPSTDERGRHAFITVDSDARSFLHFFEVPERTLHPYPLSEGAVFPPEFGALNHIALALPDEDSGLALRERLLQHDVVVTDVIDQGMVRTILFLDNNGQLGEAAWPT